MAWCVLACCMSQHTGEALWCNCLFPCEPTNAENWWAFAAETMWSLCVKRVIVFVAVLFPYILLPENLKKYSAVLVDGSSQIISNMVVKNN